MAGYIGYEQDQNITGLSAGGFWDIQEQYQIKSENKWPPGRLISDGLQCFLDITNKNSYPGSGNTWFDISGNNRNFSWVSSPSYTAGSFPYFSTLGNRCLGPASNSFGINNTSGYTVSMIMLQNSFASTSALKFYSSNGTGGASRGIFAHATWSDGTIYFDQGGCCDVNTRTFVASGGADSWNVITLQRDTNSSTRRIYKNGTLLTTNTNAAANINLSSTNVDLGSSDEYGGNSSTWNARLAGFLVYNRGLSQAEISENVESLRGRFSL
jgi:hypothetical protein